MIIRNKYLNELEEFYDQTSLIKIIYGMRRSGKSVLLEQIRDVLVKKKSEDQVIYLNFESMANAKFLDAKTLEKHIKSNYSDKKMYYLLFDEIGYVDQFELVLNSLRIEKRYSIFATGSNSKLLFENLSTKLSGRYVSFRVTPFTFKESLELTEFPDKEELLFDILQYGTLPERFLFKKERSITNYLEDTFNSIVLKDVVEELKITNLQGFYRVFQYLLDTEGREFSPKNLENYFKSNKMDISKTTVYRYLDALTKSFIMNKVMRYDVSGKSILQLNSKYYVSDLGIKRIKETHKQLNVSHNLETLVYNELLARDYEVFVGKTAKAEIDFYAIKNNLPIYIQVTYLLASQETVDREFGAFDGISDNYPKYVLSLDKLDMSQNGIIHKNIIDWLLEDEI